MKAIKTLEVSNDEAVTLKKQGCEDIVVIKANSGNWKICFI